VHHQHTPVPPFHTREGTIEKPRIKKDKKAQITEDAANERTTKISLRWTLTGKKKRSRPKPTWRRTVLKGLEEMDQDLMERTNSRSTGRVQ